MISYLLLCVETQSQGHRLQTIELRTPANARIMRKRKGKTKKKQRSQAALFPDTKIELNSKVSRTSFNFVHIIPRTVLPVPKQRKQHLDITVYTARAVRGNNRDELKRKMIGEGRS